MIYFFHHYELPAILQQIRIQEMLLQNQQAGQGNQTALQDNLNNNTAVAGAQGPAPAPGQGANTAPPAQPGAANGQPALLNEPQASTQNQTTVTSQPNGLASTAASGEVRSELDWMAETAAIITEALSSSAPAQLGGSLLESSVATSGGATVRAEGLAGAQAAISVVAEIRMGVAGGGGVTGGGGSGSTDISPGVVAVEIKTIGGSSSSSGSSQGSAAASPLMRGPQGAEEVPSSVSPSPPHTDCRAGPSAPENRPTQSPSTDWDPKTEDATSPSPDSHHPNPS